MKGIASLLAAILLLAALLTTPTAIHAASADDAVGPPAATVVSAIRMSVEASGGVYAGDCTGTRSPEDLGKRCSKLVATQGDLSAYLTGRTFSEFTSWIFVLQTPSGWCAVGSVPADSMSEQIPWPAQLPAGCAAGAALATGVSSAG